MLTAFVVTSVLGFKLQELSLFQSVRMLLAVGYFIMVLPSAILGEYWWSQWRKKPFKPRHFAFTAALLGSTLGSIGLLTYVFELLLPNLEISAQAPVLAVCSALVIVISALIARTPRVRERLNEIYS